MYFGSSQARSVIREYEFFYPKDKLKKIKKMKSFKDQNANREKQTKFDVLLTSYEMINMDSTSLKSIHWECVVCPYFLCICSLYANESRIRMRSQIFFGDHANDLYSSLNMLQVVVRCF